MGGSQNYFRNHGHWHRPSANVGGQQAAANTGASSPAAFTARGLSRIARNKLTAATQLTGAGRLAEIRNSLMWVNDGNSITFRTGSGSVSFVRHEPGGQSPYWTMHESAGGRSAQADMDTGAVASWIDQNI